MLTGPIMGWQEYGPKVVNDNTHDTLAILMLGEPGRQSSALMPRWLVRFTVQSLIDARKLYPVVASFNNARDKISR